MIRAYLCRDGYHDSSARCVLAKLLPSPDAKVLIAVVQMTNEVDDEDNGESRHLCVYLKYSVHPLNLLRVS